MIFDLLSLKLDVCSCCCSWCSCRVSCHFRQRSIISTQTLNKTGNMVFIFLCFHTQLEHFVFVHNSWVLVSTCGAMWCFYCEGCVAEVVTCCSLQKWQSESVDGSMRLSGGCSFVLNAVCSWKETQSVDMLKLHVTIMELLPVACLCLLTCSAVTAANGKKTPGFCIFHSIQWN